MNYLACSHPETPDGNGLAPFGTDFIYQSCTKNGRLSAAIAPFHIFLGPQSARVGHHRTGIVVASPLTLSTSEA